MDATMQTAYEAMAEAHDLKEWEKVVALGDAWLDARGEMPGLALVWYGQGLMAERRMQEALVVTEAAVKALRQSDPIAQCAALSNYGLALSRIGNWHEARKQFKAMVALRLTDGEAREKQGHVLMATTQRWGDAWALTEGRLDAPGRGLLPNCRAWDGEYEEPVAVLHEQGIGDAILAARWIPKVQELTGLPVTWYGPAILHDWMSACGIRVGSNEAAEHSEDLGAACRAMSLPHLLGVRRPSDVPEPIGPVALRQSRHFRSPDPDNIRVGVCWKGSAGGWHDFERSLPFNGMAPVWAPLDGVEFVNLAHQANVDPDAPFNAVSFASVYETGEVIASLDLVVSVDTSIVHMAGSLGVPTLAIVPTVPDWRYTWPHGGGTPFYPSVTVLRKQHLLDVSVVQKARALTERYTDALRRQAA